MLSATSHLVFAVFQALCLLLAAPLVSGFARVMRAKMHNRIGPGLLQDYRDICKLMQRQEVWPPDSGWLFRAMPAIIMATLLVICTGVPMIARFAPIAACGDLITVIYLFALVRFFLASSGIDSGSSFAGIGASRELTLGVLVEPTMLLSLFVAALAAGATDLGTISGAIAGRQIGPVTATTAAALAFGFAVYIELGKLPYDAGEAEQELQEGPLTEYSGPSLALLKWALALKQILLIGLFVGLFLPFGSATALTLSGVLGGLVVFALKVFVLMLAIGFVSNSVSRVRFRLLPNQTWVGVGIASLAFVFYLIGL